MAKTIADRSNAFIFVLYTFSALGLLGFVLNGLFQIDIGDTLSIIAFLFVGIGFIGLSNILGIRKFLDDGKLEGDELASIIIGGIGFIILIMASLDLFNISFLPETTTSVIQGLVAFLLLGIITFQLVLSVRRKN